MTYWDGSGRDREGDGDEQADPNADHKGKLRLRDEGLQIVILEGPGGANKRLVLDRLATLGYTTRSMKFIDFCMKIPAVDALHARLLSSDRAFLIGHPGVYPLDALTAVRWAAALIDTVDDLHRRFEEAPESFKDGLAFMSRSPLSPRAFYVAQYDPSPAKESQEMYISEAAYRLRSTRRCSFVSCKAEPDVARRTLAERYERAGPEERALRERLMEGDEDFQKQMALVYDRDKKERMCLAARGPFRGKPILDTTDPRGAAATLLRWLDIEAPPEGTPPAAPPARRGRGRPRKPRPE